MPEIHDDKIMVNDLKDQELSNKFKHFKSKIDDLSWKIEKIEKLIKDKDIKKIIRIIDRNKGIE